MYCKRDVYIILLPCASVNMYRVDSFVLLFDVFYRIGQNAVEIHDASFQSSFLTTTCSCDVQGRAMPYHDLQLCRAAKINSLP